MPSVAIPCSSFGQPDSRSAKTISSEKVNVTLLPVPITLKSLKILQFIPEGHCPAPVPTPFGADVFGALTAPTLPSGKSIIFPFNQPPPVYQF